MFHNRAQAGKELARKLSEIKLNIDETVVIALPRGGVPVAKEIANEFGFPMDVFCVKKLGHPSNPEYALGAVTEEGDYYFNPYPGISIDELEQLKKEGFKMAKSQANNLRGGPIEAKVKDKDIILVDDGIATGATVEAAIKFLKGKCSGRIILAIPVTSEAAIEKLIPEVSDLVVLNRTDNFWSVGQFYLDFSQISDTKVREMLHDTRAIA